MFKMYVDEFENAGEPWCSVVLEEEFGHQREIYNGYYDSKIITTLETTIKATCALTMIWSGNHCIIEYSNVSNGKKSILQTIN